jgi:transposase
MGQALQITRTDHTGATLRAFASKCRDGAQVRRLLAVAMVLDGHPRSLAASSNGMDRQTLSDWVHRYNDDGVDGLKTRLPPGRLPFLTGPQMAELNELVVNGPDPAINGVVRWRCADLLGEVKRRFSIEVHESTIGKWLHKLGLTRLQPRPVHPKKDPEAETAFKKHFVSLLKEALIGTTAATPIEIWFQDEARVGQKGTHAYIWAPVGSRPLMVRDNRHDSAYIFGAICPARGVGAAVIMPAANTEGMNEHLKEICTQIAPSSIAVVICDRAGWHKSSKELVVPDNIRVLPLPAYSPELNPMENVWDYLRQNKLCALVWDTYDEILEACKTAWNFLIDDPDRIRSIGSRTWACVNV